MDRDSNAYQDERAKLAAEFTATPDTIWGRQWKQLDAEAKQYFG